MVTPRSALVLLLLAASVAFVPHARAEGAEADLLQACFTAVNAATQDTACALCSEAVDGTTGSNKTVALLNLARCEESRGRLGRALDAYRAARARFGDDDPRATAVDGRIADVEARAARLTLDGSSLPPDAEVTFDDEPVTPSREPLVVGPGRHRVVVRAPTREPAEREIDLPEGGAVTIPLEVGPALAKPKPVVIEPRGLDGHRIAAYTVGAVGIAGAIAFAVTGALALDKQATVKDLCPEQGGEQICTDPRGLDAAAEGDTLNIVNAVSLGIGAAGLVTGTILLLTAPDDEIDATEVSVAVSPLGLLLKGRF